MPFQPWKDACVCVCMEVNALSPGESRELAVCCLWSSPARVPLPCVPFRPGGFMYVMRAPYSSGCFSFLVLGSSPLPPPRCIYNSYSFYPFIFILEITGFGSP